MADSIAFEVAMRLRAEMDQAAAQMQRIESHADDIAGAGKRAADSLSKIDASPLKDAGSSAAKASAEIKRSGETADEAAARIKAMVQASLEKKRAMEELVAAERASAGASHETVRVTEEQARAMAEATRAAFESQRTITAQMQSIGELQARVERGAASFDDLAETERLLDQAMAAGLVTQEEQLEIFAELDKQERALIATQEREEKQLRALIKAYDPASAALRKIADDEAKLKKAVDEGRISREQYNKAMVGLATQRAQWEEVAEGVQAVQNRMQGLNLTAREVRRSLATTGAALARGDLTGASNSLLNLGARSAISFGVMGAAVTATIGALAAFTIAAWKGYRQTQELEAMIVTTGGSLGVTRGQIEGFGDSIDAATNRIGKGREALLLLGSAGAASAEVLEDAGAAAVALSELTGQSVQQTTATVQRLMQEPAKYSAELNRQYNYLTAEIYNQIRALEQQGRTTEAVKLAVETFGNATVQRLQEIDQNLGIVEKAWHYVKLGAKAAWDEMLGIGRGQTLEDQLADASRNIATLSERRRKLLESSSRSAFDDETIARLEGQILAAQDRYKSIAGQINDEREAAAEEARAAEVERAAIAATDRQASALAQDRAIAKKQAEKKLEEDIAALRAAGIAEVDGFSLEALEAKRRKQIEEQFKEPRRGGGTSDAERDAEAQRRFVEQLERQAAVYGMTQDQVREYEIAERNLTGALRERAMAAAEVLRQAEEQRAIEADAKSLASAQIAYLRAIGREAEANERALEQQYGELMERLEKRGDTAGQKIIASLFDVEKARIELGKLQQEIDRFGSQQQRAEQRVGIERDAGLISNMEAQQRLLELRQQEIAYLQQQLPLLREQAAVLQDPATLDAIDQMELRLFELQNQASHLALSFKNAFEGGLLNAIRGLQEGTLSAGDAIRTVIADTAAGLADVAAQQLANYAATQAMQLLMRGRGDTPDVGAPDPAQAAAAGTAYAAPIAGAALAMTTASTAMGTAGGVLAAAGPTMMSGAAAIAASAVQLQAAATTLMIANSMSVAGGFAEGGFTGYGGKYQVAGWVHRGEGVLNQEEIRALGGERGFYALRAAIAKGTLPALQAPAVHVSRAPQYGFADGGFAGNGMPSLLNQMRLYLYQDLDQLRGALLNHPATEKAIVATVGQNGRAVQAEWSTS